MIRNGDPEMQHSPPQVSSERALVGELVETRRHLEDALQQIRAEKQHLQQAIGRLHETAVDLRKSISRPSRSSDTLTLLAPREKEVLRLIAEGLSTKEI